MSVISIRKATLYDGDVLWAMGQDMGRAAPETEFIPVDEDSFIATCYGLIEADTGTVLILESDGEPIGMAAAYTAPCYYNHDIAQAYQLFWWVGEGYRSSGNGTLLRLGLENWAEVVGATTFSAGTHPGLTPDGVSTGEYERSSTMYLRYL